MGKLRNVLNILIEKLKGQRPPEYSGREEKKMKYLFMLFLVR
jgi:hypothetical protein